MTNLDFLIFYKNVAPKNPVGVVEVANVVTLRRGGQFDQFSKFVKEIKINFIHA